MNITLATLSQATAQQVFDSVAAHMLAQGKRAISEDLRMYRTPDGHKCGAGCLIGDDEYDPAFENKRWGNLVAEGLVPDAHVGLIASLQKVHDQRDALEWRTRLRDVAERHGLKVHF